MMKVLEVNSDLSDSDSNNTEMSFRELEDQLPSLRATGDDNGPFSQNGSNPQHERSPSITSQTEFRDREESKKEKVLGLGIGKMNQDEVNEPSIDDKMSTNFMCRICFSDENEKDDPLISPCKCSGSMQYVHLKCLRQWLSRNENKKIMPHVTSYTWKAFHCELCKEKLEDVYRHGNATHQIFEIQKP